MPTLSRRLPVRRHPLRDHGRADDRRPVPMPRLPARNRWRPHQLRGLPGRRGEADRHAAVPRGEGRQRQHCPQRLLPDLRLARGRRHERPAGRDDGQRRQPRRSERLQAAVRLSTRSGATLGTSSTRRCRASRRCRPCPATRNNQPHDTHMTLEVIWGSGSPYAWRVLLTLEVKGLGYEFAADPVLARRSSLARASGAQPSRQGAGSA